MTRTPDPWPTLPKIIAEFRSRLDRLDARPDKRESEATA